MGNPKKIFVDNVTIVDAALLNTIFGGNDAYKTAVPPSPLAAGHIHNGRNDEWGFAPKIDLTDNIAGRLTLPQPELKSIRFSATQASPLTSSLFWTLPVPADAYTGNTQPMFLKIFWSANGSVSPGNVAFRVDWEYIQSGQNVIPPSIIARGPSAWPGNTIAINNPTTSTMRFRAESGVTAVGLYVNEAVNSNNLISLSLPATVPNATLGSFLLMGLEISSAPTVTLTSPMEQVNIFAIELFYFSQTLGINNPTPVMLQNNPGLADY